MPQSLGIHDWAAMARIRDAMFREQRRFVESRAWKKALICSRRAGKSQAAALSLIRGAVGHPGSVSRYLGLTRQTAKDIMWEPLKEWIDRLEIPGVVPNESELSMRFRSGSSFRIFGMDASVKEAKKALGGKFKQVHIDEAASFRIDLKGLVKTFIEPATMDPCPCGCGESGSILLEGTPDPDEARGFFFEVTMGKEPGWELHSWSTAQNPHMREQYLRKMADLQAKDPHYLESDEGRCMYLGQWPVNATGVVYRFDRDRNLVDTAPRITSRVISIDIGWNDASAIVEAGWAEGDRDLYLLHAEKSPAMLLDELAARARVVEANRPGVYTRWVVDGANKTAVMELRRRYGLPLEASEKQEKNHWIRMMNTDLVRGRVRVVRGACSDLVTEWTGCDEEGREVKDATPLVWDKRAQQARPPRMVEDPRCKNDCFVAGTMIETEHGPRAVETLRSGDLVWTRDGLRPVGVSMETRTAQIWEMETESGRVLRGTKTHPILANNEWTPLAELTLGSMLCGWRGRNLRAPESSDHPNESSSTARGSADTLRQRTAPSASTSSASVDAVCIALFGSTLTAPSLSASTFTTRTVTPSTTTSATLNCATDESICPSTLVRQVEPTCHGALLASHAKPLVCGTAAKRDERGIVSTDARHGLAAPCTNVSVSCAAGAFSRRSLERRCAAGSATPSDDVTPAWMMSCVPASGAAWTTEPADSSVVATAPDRVRRVTATNESAPVFNLSVRGTPEYFANGILVHNCSDAALYAFRYARNFLEEPEETVRPKTSEEQLAEFFEGRRERLRGAVELDEDDMQVWG